MAGVDGASLFDAIFDAVFVVSPDGTVKGANRQALTAFAAQAGGVAGADAFSFFSCDGAGTLRKIRGLAPDGGFHVLETRCLRRDGTSFQGELAIGRISGEGDGGAGGDFCFVSATSPGATRRSRTCATPSRGWRLSAGPGWSSSQMSRTSCGRR